MGFHAQNHALASEERPTRRVDEGLVSILAPRRLEFAPRRKRLSSPLPSGAGTAAPCPAPPSSLVVVPAPALRSGYSTRSGQFDKMNILSN